MFKNKKFWQAVATLIGMVIGAGILGLPYVISRTGVLLGIIILIALGVASMLVNLMIAEIILRTRFRHQLVGLVKKYLGKNAKYAQALSMMIGYYGALTAYIVGQGEILATIFNFGSAFWFSLIFVLFGVVVLFVGLNLIKKIEYWSVIMILFVVLIISFLSLPNLNIYNYYQFDLSKIFSAYGVILFAFGGTGAIFSMREILRGQEKLLKPAIVTGSLIPMLIYILFALIVIGVSGLQTTQIATIGLGSVLGYKILLFSNIFAFLAMGTSFFTVGLALKQIFEYDFRFPAWSSWLLVISLPLLIFLFLSHDFIKIIGIAGSLTFGLSGILIIFTYWQSKNTGDQDSDVVLPKFKVVGWILIVMFVVGILYTIFDLL